MTSNSWNSVTALELTHSIAAIHDSQKRSPSVFSPQFTMRKTRVSSSTIPSSNIVSLNPELSPNQPFRAQSWPRMPPSCETCETSLLTRAVEESRFDAYSDDGAGSEMNFERKLGKLKRFGRRMSNAFRCFYRA